MYPAFLLAALLHPALAATPVDPYEYLRAVELLQKEYLFVDEVDAPIALEKAARRLESEIPWLFVDTAATGVTLKGPDGRLLVTVQASGLEDLPDAFQQMHAAVQGAPEGVPEKCRIDEAILRGMASTLDRWSMILTESAADARKEKHENSYSGVGLRDHLDDGHSVVREVAPQGPAEGAGLLAGDEILAVDGIPVTGMGREDLTRALRGPSGSRVRVRTLRNGQERDVEIVRGPVHWPDGKSRVLDSGLAWIHIEKFSTQIRDWLAGDLYQLDQKGALDKGIVLDLRENSGGPNTAWLWVADALLARGRIMRSVSVVKLKHKGRVDATKTGTDPEGPIVVLVDDETASASERLAMSLVANERAILVGSGTVGKGSGWRSHYVGDGLRFQLTCERAVFGEDERPIPVAGLVPDVPLQRLRLDEHGGRVVGEDAGLLWVDEKSGWRPGDAPTKRDDFALTLAERILLATKGSTRQDLLAAARVVIPEVRKEESDRLSAALTAHGLDGSATDASTPRLRVQVTPTAPPRAGQDAVLDVSVENTGDTPASQVLVRLVPIAVKDPRNPNASPWDDLLFPIGRVDPGQTAHAPYRVNLPVRTRTRTDAFALRVQAGGVEVEGADATRLTVQAAPDPRVAVTARWSAEGGGRVHLVLENRGSEAIPRGRASLAFPDPDLARLGIEAVPFEGIPAGGTAEVDLPLEVQAKAVGKPLDLSLRLSIHEAPDPPSLPLLLPQDGSTVQVQPPWSTWTAPSSGVVGSTVTLHLDAGDDAPLRHVVVRAGDRKISYLPSPGPAVDVDIPVTLVAGPNTVEAVVEDAMGVRDVSCVQIWGDAPTP